jgi:hypothetical protein
MQANHCAGAARKQIEMRRTGMTINKKRLGLRLTLVLALVAASLGMAEPSSALTGAKRMLVVLCNFQNQTFAPGGTADYSRDYYRDMFSSQGEGLWGSYDYWRDISYGQFGLDATVVGWYTIPKSRDAWAGDLDRNRMWKECVEQAKDDVHYEAFIGAWAIYPESITRTATAVGAGDTTVYVNDVRNFPAPPFGAQIIGQGTQEWIVVTGVDAAAATFTVQRAQLSSTAVDHVAGSWLQARGADFFGQEPQTVELAGTAYPSFGRAFGPHDISLTGALHETVHLVGLDHSTAASTLPSEYNDCHDVASAYGCVYMFDHTIPLAGKKFGGSIFYPKFGKGPGLNSVNVDTMGWLPDSRKATFDNSSCRQQTYTMTALNRPGISGIQQLRFPGLPFVFDYFAVELRHKNGWDRGIPASAFLLHGKLADGRSMLIDEHPDGTPIGDARDGFTTQGVGALVAGDGYANPTLGMYVGVHSIGNGIGTVTMGSCKLDVDLDYVGATQGRYSDSARLAGRLTVAGSTAPVPGAAVNLGVGGSTCTDRPTQRPRGVTGARPGARQLTATASYAGSSVYQSASDSASITVEKEITTLVYAGTGTSDYPTPSSPSRSLSRTTARRGHGVTFTLGSGDGCTATTSSGGVASCSITPSQPASSYTMSTSFSGILLPVELGLDPFTITHESPRPRSQGRLCCWLVMGPRRRWWPLRRGRPERRRHRPDGGPIWQTISFTLGNESCSDTTDSNGVAQCSVNVPPSLSLGPQPVTATFAGDAYYEPSSGTKDAIVFAFPSTGAFALGDITVASATPTSTVTWWSDAWWTLNSLSGGTAHDSFKGFAATLTQLPTTNPADSCGTTFSTPPGNSATPPTSVPSYMGVIVASSADKNKKGVNGTWGGSWS